MTEAVHQTKADRTQARILSCAISLFSERSIDQVSFVDIATCAGLTSQALYRYYSGKQELYLYAVSQDIEVLQNAVLEQTAELTLPHFTAEFWAAYSEQAKKHPLAQKGVSSRDPQILTLLTELPSSRKCFESGRADLRIAQKIGLIRADIDVDVFSESLFYMSTKMLIPLIFEGKFAGEEWLSVERILTASIISPVPDLTSAVAREQFEAGMREAALLQQG